MRQAIQPASFYRNHLKPPPNPWAESDARTKAAVDKAVSDAHRAWTNELKTLHTTMLRKRLATALQLPTLSKPTNMYWVKVQVEGITHGSSKCAAVSVLCHPQQVRCCKLIYACCTVCSHRAILQEWEQDGTQTWETLDQGVLQRTASFESLKNIKGFAAMKLFKATQKQLGEVTAMLTVPARAWHTTRPDGTMSLSIFCHTAVLSKVSTFI